MTKIKPLLFLFTFLFSEFSVAQHCTPLKEYYGYDSISENRCIVYGNFISRVGFNSGVMPHLVRIINIETNFMFSMVVKPTNKSKKENNFIFFIRPGTYEILNYQWNSKGFIVTSTYTQTIQKNPSSTEDTSAINSTRYRFTVDPNSLTYIGTWHFEEPHIFFIYAKEILDEQLKKKLALLNYSKALVSIPK